MNLNWAQAYVQFGGRTLSYYNQPGNYTRFFHANALGSLGMATDWSGAYVEEMLYYPWGQGWTNDSWDARFASMPANRGAFGVRQLAAAFAQSEVDPAGSSMIWSPATCPMPKDCGSKLPHGKAAASCRTPKSPEIRQRTL